MNAFSLLKKESMILVIEKISAMKIQIFNVFQLIREHFFNEIYILLNATLLLFQLILFNNYFYFNFFSYLNVFKHQIIFVKFLIQFLMI